MASSVKMFPAASSYGVGVEPNVGPGRSSTGDIVLPDGVKITMPKQLKKLLAKTKRQQLKYTELWSQHRTLRQENERLKKELAELWSALSEGKSSSPKGSRPSLKKEK